MTRTALWLAGAACAVCLSGCGTVCNIVDPSRSPPPLYGGVQEDWTSLVDAWEEWRADKALWPWYFSVIGAGARLVDLPLSAVGDTVTLPAVLLANAREDGWFFDKAPVTPGGQIVPDSGPKGR